MKTEKEKRMWILQQLLKHSVAERGLNIDDSCLKNDIDSMKKWEKLGEMFVTRILNATKKKTKTKKNAATSSAKERMDSLSWVD